MTEPIQIDGYSFQRYNRQAHSPVEGIYGIDLIDPNISTDALVNHCSRRNGRAYVCLDRHNMVMGYVAYTLTKQAYFIEYLSFVPDNPEAPDMLELILTFMNDVREHGTKPREIIMPVPEDSVDLQCTLRDSKLARAVAVATGYNGGVAYLFAVAASRDETPVGVPVKDRWGRSNSFTAGE